VGIPSEIEGGLQDLPSLDGRSFGSATVLRKGRYATPLGLLRKKLPGKVEHDGGDKGGHSHARHGHLAILTQKLGHHRAQFALDGLGLSDDRRHTSQSRVVLLVREAKWVLGRT